MKKLSLLFSLIALILGANVLGYLYVDDYRFLLRKFKYPDEIVYVENRDIKEEYDIGKEDFNPVDSSTNSENNLFEEDIEDNSKVDEKPQIIIIENTEKTEEKPEIKEEKEGYEESEFEEDFITFFDKFSLKLFPSDVVILGFLTDYLDDFHKYKGDKIEVYLFGYDKYSDMKKYFENRSDLTGFKLNEVNNFGEKSLYLNSKTDSKIRVLIEYEGYAYLIQIEKEVYPEIKDILQTL